MTAQTQPQFEVGDVIKSSHNGVTIVFRVDTVVLNHHWYEGAVLACDKPGYHSYNTKAFLPFVDAANPQYGWTKCYSIKNNIEIET